MRGKEKASAFVSGLQSFRTEQETVGIKIPHLLKNNYNSIHFYFSLSKSIEDIFNHSDGVSGKLYQCFLCTFCKLPKKQIVYNRKNIYKSKLSPTFFVTAAFVCLCNHSKEEKRAATTHQHLSSAQHFRFSQTSVWFLKESHCLFHQS